MSESAISLMPVPLFLLYRLFLAEDRSVEIGSTAFSGDRKFTTIEAIAFGALMLCSSSFLKERPTLDFDIQILNLLLRTQSKYNKVYILRNLTAV
ncbi:hypothetical protein GCM10011511_15840 [Puia dinghuensis]|uniref:Uncharacterized protein n=1 Tax=Puia dinghuensis TaxID=1792502 RepID=A0A8J2UBR4_9BACT|nr:hypothetical protein GCM10011511_15840 [Puia dinghuensis]